VINKTNNDFKDVHFKLVENKGTLNLVGNQRVKVAKQEIASGTIFIEINQYLLESDKTKLKKLRCIAVIKKLKLVQRAFKSAYFD
jgi:hypothetical protein